MCAAGVCILTVGESRALTDIQLVMWAVMGLLKSCRVNKHTGRYYNYIQIHVFFFLLKRSCLTEPLKGHGGGGVDPRGVKLRQARRLRQRSYFSKGPNFIWHLDSYDKLRPYGICINGSINGFSRKIMWLNAYTTNSDPKLIGGYYIEAVQHLGGLPQRRPWDQKLFC